MKRYRGRSGVYLVKSVHMFLDEGGVKNTSIYRVYDHQLTKFRRAVTQTVMTLSKKREKEENRKGKKGEEKERKKGVVFIVTLWH